MNTEFQLAHFSLLEDIILNKVSVKKDWLKIKYRFNCIYPTLFLDYIKRGISLSHSEEKYILLQKIGMNPKTISEVLEVLPESVYTLKYRLQKKINSHNN